MLFLILFMLSILGPFSLAGEIVTDVTQIDKLQKQLRENPYYRQIGPLKFEIFNFEVGLPLTPFYIENHQIKRFYQRDHKCYELTVHQNKNIAHKVHCVDKKRTLYLKGLEEFKVVDRKDLINEGLKGFRTDQFSESYRLLGYLQEWHMFNMDQNIYGEEVNKLAPKKEFNVHLNGLTEILLDDKNFELRQNLSLKMERMGILSEKLTSQTNNIKQRPGSLIFSNGQGRVIIYNSLLDSPLGSHQLLLNNELPVFFKKLMNESLKSPVCFRDDYINSVSQDCQSMIFNSHNLGIFRRIRLVEIDFVKQEVNFILP